MYKYITYIYMYTCHMHDVEGFSSEKTWIRAQEGLRQKEAILGAVFSVLQQLRLANGVPDYTMEAPSMG